MANIQVGQARARLFSSQTNIQHVIGNFPSRNGIPFTIDDALNNANDSLTSTATVTNGVTTTFNASHDTNSLDSTYTPTFCAAINVDDNVIIAVEEFTREVAPNSTLSTTFSFTVSTFND